MPNSMIDFNNFQVNLMSIKGRNYSHFIFVKFKEAIIAILHILLLLYNIGQL